MPQSTALSRQRPITVDELAKKKVGAGTTNKEMWMAINGVVYDVTRFTQFHPGGVLLMQKYSGMDATVAYAKNHTNVPVDEVIGGYRIGPLVPNPTPQQQNTPSAGQQPPLVGGAKGSAGGTLGVPQQQQQQLQRPQQQQQQQQGPSKAPPLSSSATGQQQQQQQQQLPAGQDAAFGFSHANLRYPPIGASSVTPYVPAPHRNPSSSTALEVPLNDVVHAARGSGFFNHVGDEELAAAALASRNNRRAKRDSFDPQFAHGAVEGTPSAEVVAADTAEDEASIACVFDLLDSEGRGSIRIDQLEGFLISIGGFPDVRSAREALREVVVSMPSIKASGRITKEQFIAITNSLQ